MELRGRRSLFSTGEGGGGGGGGFENERRRGEFEERSWGILPQTNFEI